MFNFCKMVQPVPSPPSLGKKYGRSVRLMCHLINQCIDITLQTTQSDPMHRELPLRPADVSRRHRTNNEGISVAHIVQRCGWRASKIERGTGSRLPSPITCVKKMKLREDRVGDVVSLRHSSTNGRKNLSACLHATSSKRFHEVLFVLILVHYLTPITSCSLFSLDRMCAPPCIHGRWTCFRTMSPRYAPLRHERRGQQCSPPLLVNINTQSLVTNVSPVYDAIFGNRFHELPDHSIHMHLIMLSHSTAFAL